MSYFLSQEQSSGCRRLQRPIKIIDYQSRFHVTSFVNPINLFIYLVCRESVRKYRSEGDDKRST